MTARMWDYTSCASKGAEPYGDTTTYERGLGWLAETCESIEDWGAGAAFGRRYVPEGRYFAIDSAPSSAPFVDKVGDLRSHRSAPDGIFMRHALEHNRDWEHILANAMRCFTKRMVLVIFTPFGLQTAPVRPQGDPYLDLSFRKADLAPHFAGCHVTEEHLNTGTQYGSEHVFYISRPGWDDHPANVAADGSMEPGRVWDCFTFFNELDLLECRLTELEDSPVHKHVLVEATTTFTGQPKPLYFAENRDRFARWADRIVHVVAASLPTAGSPWQAEAAQREVIAAGLHSAWPNDLILLSDVDEIPDPKAIGKAEPGGGVQAFTQRLASFAVDWVHADPWHGTTCAYLRNIPSFHAMRGQRDTAGNDIPDGGWHLSWLGGHEAMRAKLHAFSHTEMVPRIEAGIDAGEYLERGVFWGRDARACDGTGSEQLLAVDVDETWPRWVWERKCPPEWFRPREPASPPPAAAGLRVNLGCGSRPEDGWVNVDAVALDGVNVVHDLDTFPWPFKDGEAARIKAYDVFEHVGKPLEFMRECWRVLAPGGVLDIHTTHWRSRNAYTDPTHRRYCTEDTFDYWVPGTYLHERYGAAYAQDCHFEKVGVGRDGTELAVLLKKLP